MKDIKNSSGVLITVLRSEGPVFCLLVSGQFFSSSCLYLNIFQVLKLMSMDLVYNGDKIDDKIEIVLRVEIIVQVVCI